MRLTPTVSMRRFPRNERCEVIWQRVRGALVVVVFNCQSPGFLQTKFVNRETHSPRLPVFLPACPYKVTVGIKPHTSCLRIFVELCRRGVCHQTDFVLWFRKEMMHMELPVRKRSLNSTLSSSSNTTFATVRFGISASDRRSFGFAPISN